MRIKISTKPKHWFSLEYGYSNRMIKQTLLIMCFWHGSTSCLNNLYFNLIKIKLDKIESYLNVI